MYAENQTAEEAADHPADMKVAERSCPYVTTERPDRNIAVRRQREALMVHQAEDPAEEIPLRTPSEMACHQDLPEAASVPVRRDRLRKSQTQATQVLEDWQNPLEPYLHRRHQMQ